MTGTECFHAALNLLSRNAEQRRLLRAIRAGALNQLLANSLREINAERVSCAEQPYTAPPQMDSAGRRRSQRATGWRASASPTGWQPCSWRMTTRPNSTGLPPNTPTGCCATVRRS